MKILNRVARAGLVVLALLFAGVVTNVGVSWARYTIQNPTAGYMGFFNEALGRVVYRFGGTAGTGLEFDKIGADGTVVGEMDTQSIMLRIADLGTASSTYVVIPTTGVIVAIYITPEGEVNGSSAVIAMYASTVGSLNPSVYTAGSRAQYLNSQVTGFSVTITATGSAGVGTVFSDTAINQAVNMGDVIAIETDGGPTNAVGAWVTLRLRMQ